MVCFQNLRWEQQSHNYYLKSGQKYYDATEQNKSRLDKFNFCGEFNYPDYELLNKKTKKGKEYLEDLFDSKIFNFVPPSNQINKMGIKSLINNKLNMSGLVGYRYDRELSLKGYQAFFKRVFFNLENRYLFNNSLVYEMPHESFDLDEKIDFEFLEFLVTNNKLSFNL